MCTESLGREHPSSRSVFHEKDSRCVIYSANAAMDADAVVKRNHTWFFCNKVASDLIVQIGENAFHLHKLPVVSRSGHMNRLVLDRRSRNSGTISITMDDIPGGVNTFELVVKFCYGMHVELTATNIAPLYCAAHFLEMSDDLQQGNLISKTEAFLSFLILSSWKDTIRILKSCESISAWATELQILRRGSESIASKACMHPNYEFKCFELSAGKENNSGKGLDSIWWFKDLSLLRIDHFLEVIALIKKKGVKPDLVGSCLAYWTRNWLSRMSVKIDKQLMVQLHRVTIESLIKILPKEENSVCCNFLLHLLKIGIMIKVSVALVDKLERRIALMLESSAAKDLLVKSYGYGGDSIYDVSIVVRVVEAYVSLVSVNPSAKVRVVGRLVDQYLALVARDDNLPANVFQLLVEALPKDSRYCNNNLYRAIDMYLKAHPSLTEKERNGICRSIEYHKLSQEARKHATKNGRLPMNITTRFMLLEQVNTTRSVTAAGSNFFRTKSQAIMRVSESLAQRWMSPKKEIRMMKEDVETIKLQLHELQLCKRGLQRQMQSGFR